jgi:hypothetical protein
MWLMLLQGALAGGGHDDEARDPWAEVDRAVAALAPAPETGPFSRGLLLRAFYTDSPEEAQAVASGPSVSGFVLEDADAYFAYDQGDVAWRLSAEFDSGSAELEDAWASWRYFDWLALSAGQFKPRVVRSGSVAASELLFRERTFLGAAFDAWDDGFELGGHYDQFDYWLALTDGSNGAGSDHFTSARGEWALYDAAFEDREGARGAPGHLRVLAGASWFGDAALSSSDGGGWGADLALTFGPWSFHGEWADLDEEFARTIDVFNGYLITLGDGKPFAGTLGCRVGRDAELAVRFQGADDVDSTEAFGAALNWNPGGGPARFVADLALVEGDTRDFSLFSAGIVLGSSGLSRPFAEEPAP